VGYGLASEVGELRSLRRACDEPEVFGLRLLMTLVLCPLAISRRTTSRPNVCHSCFYADPRVAGSSSAAGALRNGDHSDRANARFARPNIRIYDARVVDLYQWACARYPEGAETKAMAEGEELGSNLLRFAKRASASKANGCVSQKLERGDFKVRPLRLPLQIPERERDAEQPVRTVRPCFRLRLQPRSWWGVMTRARFIRPSI